MDDFYVFYISTWPWVLNTVPYVQKCIKFKITYVIFKMYPVKANTDGEGLLTPASRARAI